MALVRARQHPDLWDVLTYVRWAVEHSDLRPADRTLAIAVATFYNHDDGYARPSWPGLMATFGYGRSALASRLAAITAAGIWHTDTHAKRATRYRFPVGRGPERRTPEPAATIHRGPERRTPEPSTGVPNAGPQGSRTPDPNQLLEPSRAIGTRRDLARAEPPPWKTAGITYAEWRRREEAATGQRL